MIVIKVDHKGGWGDVKSVYFVRLTKLCKIPNEVLLITYLPMILKMIVTEGALVHHMKFHHLRGLCPLKMNKRKFIILDPNFSSIKSSSNQLMIVSFA